MRKFTFFILNLTIVITANSQNIFGKWYGINDDGLVDFDISVDSLKGQVLKIGYEKGFERQNTKHSGIFTVSDKTLIVVPDKTSASPSYRALTIFSIKEKISIEIAANGINTSTSTIEELLNLNKNHQAELFGNIIFSEDYLSRLRQLKDIEFMSIDEFKLFLKNYVDQKETFKYREQLMPGTFLNQLTTRILIKMGFNL